MKVPFRYQATEHDCVPTAFTNALLYLFDRKEIPPAVVQKIMLYSLDEENQRGTTGEAVLKIMRLLDDNFELKTCKHLPQEQIHLRQGSELLSCIDRGGVALLRVCKDPMNTIFHYILALGVDEKDSDWILFHDPYYRVNPFLGEDGKYIKLIESNRQGANLKIKRERLDNYEYERYSMCAIEERECCLLERA